MKQLNWYQIFGKSNIPDGRTVLPTDDIQIWLNCANIWYKTYTTLAEVLADTDTLLALISSNNAVDYMVRSTTWAVSVNVPTMTSNTAPNGQCLYSNQNSGQEAYKAFDRNDSTFWNTAQTSVPQRIGYKFTEAHPIFNAKVKFASYNTLSTVKIQKSDDGVTWEDASTETLVSGQTEAVISVDGSTHAYWSMYISAQSRTSTYVGITTALDFYTEGVCDNSTAMTYIGQNNYCANTLLADATWCNAICNSEYFENVLNVKVPVMTSATTPEGEVSATSYYDATTVPYKAFDGNNSTNWSSSLNASNQRLMYRFAAAQKIYFVKMKIPYDQGFRVSQFTIKASNDGVNFDTLQSLTTLPNVNDTDHQYVIAPSQNYLYYALDNMNTYKYTVSMYELQFYGRKDI